MIAVAAGVVFDGGEAVELLGGPGDEQRAGALERDADFFGVVEQQPVAARDEPGFQRAGLGVIAGVQDRGVGLAGAGADVARVQEHDAQLKARQFARDGGADIPGADDCDVVVVAGVR